MIKFEKLSKADVVFAISLTIASLISYLISYYVLEPFVNHPNDLLGGMWATVSTVFVFREAKDLPLRAGVARFFATCVSCVLTFILSGGAAILVRYGGHALQPWQTVLVLSAVSALWLVVAVYFLGDISAHFNPAMTLAFALRRDMGWVMAGAYWVVQFAAAVCGSLLARAFFGVEGNLAATMPPPGLWWQAAGFEAIITFGLVLMVLNMANGPKLNGPFVPLAVGAYIMAWGTMGGPFDGASMNPARSFGPDLAVGNLSTWWVYLIGPVAGAVIAVGVAYVLRGPAKAQEAMAAMGTPLDQGT